MIRRLWQAIWCLVQQAPDRPKVLARLQALPVLPEAARMTTKQPPPRWVLQAPMTLELWRQRYCV